MLWIDSLGYLASSLVLLTFCMKTLLPLRAIAVCSNVAFLAYGYLAAIYPVLILHAILLPVNLWRAREMIFLIRRVEAAATAGFSVSWLKPYMKSALHPPEAVVFRKGDVADRLYVVISGEIVLEELGVHLRQGDVFGEIGLFSPDKRRTQTARCLATVELLWISEAELIELCQGNPSIAFHFLRLITNRLSENVIRAEAHLRAVAAREPGGADVARSA